jgi:hypothetical protein
VFDLDGVVYLGDEVIGAAPAALDRVRGLGVAVVFVTNNSYRPPDLVVEKLHRLGVRAAPEEVLTSAQALVRMLGGPAGLVGSGSWSSAGLGYGRRWRRPGRGWSTGRPGVTPRWWRSGSIPT